MVVQSNLPLPYSEEWWRVTLASIGDAVIVTDTKGAVTFMNPVAESLTGWTKEQAQHQALETVFPILHETSRASVANPVSQVLQTGVVVELANHTVLRARNGIEIPIDDSAAPIRDAQGNIFGVVLIFRDITERKRAEAAQRQLAAIIASSDDAIISKTLDSRITSWNKAAERVFGYGADEVIGQPITLLIPPERQEEEDMIIVRLKRGERIEHFETVRCRKDGTRLDISLTISPIKDSAGNIIGASKIARDITEQKRAEAAQAYLAAIVESSEDAIVGKTLASIITSWNQAAERIFGYTATEAIGQPVYLIIPPERHVEEAQILERIKRGERIEHFETVRRRKNGTPIDVSLTISPIKDRAGNIIGASKIARDISVSKQLESSLRKNEERLQLSHQITGVGDWEWNSATNEVFWSPEYRRIYGLDPQEVPSFERGMAIVLAEDREAVGQAIAHALSTGEEYRSEHRIHHPHNGLRWIQAIGKMISDGSQAFRGMIGIVLDVTAQKQAEQELRESAERLSLAFEAAELGDWSWEAATNEVTLSTRAAMILGVQGTHVPWSELRVLLHEEDHVQASQAVTLGLAANARFNIEYRVRQDEKDWHWVAAKAQAIYDHAGQLQCIRGVVQNITERKLASARLEEEREALKIINQVGQMLSAELDLQKLVQRLTDMATEITGAQFGSFFYNVLDEHGASYMLYTLSGVPREQFAHFPMPRATDIFGPTFRGEGIIRNGNVKQNPRYGKNSPYFGIPEGHLPVTSYLAVPVISRSGDVLGGLFFGHYEADIFTARHESIMAGLAGLAAIAIDNARLYEATRKAQVEAEDANRLKDEFLATVSHELRTPLNAILGWARMLRMGGLNEESCTRAIGIIEKSAVAQGQIIEDILDVSRIITGKLRLEVSPVEIVRVVEEVVESVRLTADAKGVRLQSVLDTKTNLVAGDAHRLQQVLWNLLTNAIKFTPKKGRVQVTLARINSHVEITVSDTGQGIKPEFLPHVFERFRQADSSTTRTYGGLGLGLAIVRHLTELHGGTVSAASDGEGQGATFRICLPLAILREGDSFLEEPQMPRFHWAIDETVTSKIAQELTGVRVLVVDDEGDARELLQTVLEQCGAEVRAVGSARTAIETLRQWRPDVLVSDIGMPGEDGYELIRQVRAMTQKEGGSIPATALTAYARSEDRLRALKAGFQMHVAKPVEPVELVTVVASLAGKTGSAKDIS